MVSCPWDEGTLWARGSKRERRRQTHLLVRVSSLTDPRSSVKVHLRSKSSVMRTIMGWVVVEHCFLLEEEEYHCAHQVPPSPTASPPAALCCVRGATVAKDAAGLARLLAFWVNLKPSNSSSQNSRGDAGNSDFSVTALLGSESLAKGRRLRRRGEGGWPGAQRDPDPTDPLSRDRVRGD